MKNGMPMLTRIVASLVVRTMVDRSWIDDSATRIQLGPSEALVAMPDSVWQQAYENTTILLMGNSGYLPWLDHFLSNLAALQLLKHVLVV